MIHKQRSSSIKQNKTMLKTDKHYQTKILQIIIEFVLSLSSTPGYRACP